MIKIIGIYSITNTLNNKRYIGYSIDIQRRWATHKRDLKNNKHENDHLQKAYNKYGEDAFKFEIIEECTKENTLLLQKRTFINRDNMIHSSSKLNMVTIGNAQSSRMITNNTLF